MNEVEIEIVRLKVSQGLIDSDLNSFRLVVSVPELACELRFSDVSLLSFSRLASNTNKYLFPWYA